MLPILTDYLKRLENIYADLRRALTDLPTEALDWVPGPNMNSIGVMATHTAESQRYWIGEVVGGQPANRNRQAEFLAYGQDSPTLIQRLDEGLAQIRTVLERITLDDLSVIRTSPYRDHDFTIAWVLNHTLAHVASHLGHIEVTRQFRELHNKDIAVREQKTDDH